jgi:phosphoesterase RecJ-like protein
MTLDARACEAVQSAVSGMKRPLLISHVNPDGDALGSLSAMRDLLIARHAEPRTLLFDEIPRRYALFEERGPWTIRRDRPVPARELHDRDGVIVFDTCTYNQLSPVAEWLRNSALPKVAVDHHVTRDDLADTYLIDESAAATCLMIYEWCEAIGWSIPPVARQALFVGMATDTGWFIHSNTDGRVLRAASELVSQGVAAHELHGRIYQADSPARVRLLGAALATMELHAENRLSVLSLSSGDIRGVGATSADTEDIVNEPMRIADVVVSVLLVEQDDGVVRISLRSKPPTGVSLEDDGQIGRLDVDVAQLARSIGGGGHARAAGAKIHGSLAEVSQKVIQRLIEAFA